MTAVAISAPEAPAAPKRTLPTYNGFGSFEDSAQNCTSLLPQPPKKNFYSLMQVPQRHVHVAFIGMGFWHAVNAIHSVLNAIHSVLLMLRTCCITQFWGHVIVQYWETFGR